MMDNTSNTESNIFYNYFETQKEILAMEIRKTKNILITLSVIVFGSDLLALVVANAVVLTTLLIILIVPLLLFGFSLLAPKEPMTAMIAAIIIMVGIWTYMIVITNGTAAISGWLVKAVIIYFLIAGYGHAKEANRIKRELNL